MADNLYVCCICGRYFRGYGNNPYPVVKDPGARCCNACDVYVVIPARLQALHKRKDGDKNDDTGRK